MLLLSAITDSAIVFQALEQGAAGYLGKDARRVADRRRRAVGGGRAGRWCRRSSPGALAGEIRLRAQPPGPVLSEREMQVLQAASPGA